jgi:hypothetical protein
MCLIRYSSLFGVLVLPSIDLQFAVSPLDPEPFPCSFARYHSVLSGLGSFWELDA